MFLPCRWVQIGCSVAKVTVSEVLTGLGRRGDRDLRRCWRASGSELPEGFRQLRLESHWQSSDQGFLGGDIFGAPESVSTGGSAS